MKYHLIILISFLTLLCSCSRPEPSIIDFEGQKFKLPMRVDEAKKSLGLAYGYYHGFSNNSIQTQLENYPLFLGSDNDSEESYYEDYFVGITFYKENVNLEQIKSEIQNKYDKVFKSKTINFDKTKSFSSYTMTYHYLLTDDNFFVALKEGEGKIGLEKYISISFYKGISESELDDYLEYVY